MQLKTASTTPAAVVAMPIPANQPSEASLLLAQARNAAFAEASQGRIGRGLNLLQDALEVEPLSHDLMSDMAALLLAAGEFEHAVAYAQRALEVKPSHGPSLYTLGFGLSGLGKVERAINVLTRLSIGEAQTSLLADAPELAPLAQAELARLMELLNHD